MVLLPGWPSEMLRNSRYMGPYLNFNCHTTITCIHIELQKKKKQLCRKDCLVLFSLISFHSNSNLVRSHQTIYARLHALTCANSFMSFLYFSQTFHKPAKRHIKYGNTLYCAGIWVNIPTYIKFRGIPKRNWVCRPLFLWLIVLCSREIRLGDTIMDLWRLGYT